ncbi:MAG: response regulator [Candidatus Omnitrophica bacterium]|nr:response regulator [Candidatus Omnitrophota bacterium]
MKTPFMKKEDLGFLFEQVVDDISDGFFVLDEDFTVKLFNRSAEILLGRDKKEVLGYELFEVFPEARGSEFEKNYTKAIKEKIPLFFETYFGIPPYDNWYEVKVTPHMKGGINVLFKVTTKIKKDEKIIYELSKFPSENPNPVLRVTNEGDLIYANKAAKVLFENSGQTVENYLSGFLKNKIKESVDLEKIVNVEVDLGNKNVIFILAPMIENGYVNMYGMDMTDRKFWEQSLKLSEARYSELFDNMVGGVAVYEAVKGGEDFIIKDINKAGCVLSKIKKDEVIGVKVTKAFPSVREFGLLDVLKNVYKSGKPERHPVTFYDDGRLEAWYENYVYKLPSGEIVALYQDLTEKQKEKERISNEKAYAEKIVETIIEPLLVLDMDLCVVSINKSFCENFQVEYDKTIGKKIYDLGNGQWDIPLLRKLLENILPENSTIENFEVEHHFEIIGHKIMRLNARTIIPDLGDKKEFILLAVEDITERKMAKQALQEAKDKAEYINKAKTEFLMNISHDIRTPMNVINGFVDLLFKSDLTKEQKNYCGMIKRKGTDLISLIEGIVDISALEKGKVRMHKSSVSLSALAEDIRKTVDVLIGDKKIKFSYDITCDVPEKLISDSLRLKQILENLCGNAVKYSEKGEISLSISAKVKKDNDQISIVKFIVKDSGFGIPEDKIKYIFDPYSRFYELGKGKEKDGVGMGLHIVKTIVEEMGGTINVESKEGEGSTFFFEIEMEKHIAESIEEKPKPKIITEEILLDGVDILIADDDEDNRELMKMMFQEENCKVQFARDGVETVAAIKKKKFDIILMDLRMPKIDGFEAAKIIRRDIDKTVPILALTAHVMDWVEGKCIEAGMNGYISKPIDVDKLKSAIKEYVVKKG